MDLDELDENKYNNFESKFYTYNVRDIMLTNIEDVVDIKKTKHIFICPYEINNEGKYPFLKFLLCKNIFDKLDFLQMSLINEKVIISENIKELTKKYLNEIVGYENYMNFTEKLIINGFYVYKGEVFIFVDLTNCKLNINDVYSENKLWFTLMHEIINIKRVCNLHIEPFVTHFFNNNYNFCLLENEKNETYEAPIIGYVGKIESKLKFTYTFGESTKDKNAILGAYYYFTDYKNAIKNAYDLSVSSNKNTGIVKFALFAGTTKYIENFSSDNIDNSEIKKQRLEDETLDRNYEQLTVRISDHDGLWSKEADSCYLGNLILENGCYLKDTPLLVLKEYNQQVPLS
jgi:hypothetical protein